MYDAYQQKLTNYCCVIVVVCVIAMIALTFFVLFERKSYKEDRDKSSLFYMIGGIALIVCSMVIIGRTSYKTASDINNQNYVTYEGAFEAGKSVGSCVVTIVDDSGKKIALIGTSDFYGKNKGKIIYGKKTRVIVDYWLTNE